MFFLKVGHKLDMKSKFIDPRKNQQNRKVKKTETWPEGGNWPDPALLYLLYYYLLNAIFQDRILLLTAFFHCVGKN